MKSITIFSVLLVLHIQATWADVCTTKPDFGAPGRRLSEQKCREYNWEKKCSSSKDAEANQRPYLGSIAFRNKNEKLSFACAATLISPKFAVTTAHCLNGIGGLNAEFVRFGNKDIKAEQVIDAKIVRKLSHPQYIAPKFAYDIGLLEFENPLPINNVVAPACLWSQPDITTNQDVEVAAWATRDQEIPNILNTMKVHVIDSKTCGPLIESYYNRRWKKLEDHQLCVNETDTEGYFCRGSSGAPIVTSVPLEGGDKMSYVQAYASFGRGCDPGIAIYIKIASFVDWIEQTVWS